MRGATCRCADTDHGGNVAGPSCRATGARQAEEPTVSVQLPGDWHHQRGVQQQTTDLAGVLSIRAVPQSRSCHQLSLLPAVSYHLSLLPAHPALLAVSPA